MGAKLARGKLFKSTYEGVKYSGSEDIDISICGRRAYQAKEIFGLRKCVCMLSFIKSGKKKEIKKEWEETFCREPEASYCFIFNIFSF